MIADSYSAHCSNLIVLHQLEPRAKSMLFSYVQFHVHVTSHKYYTKMSSIKCVKLPSAFEDLQPDIISWMRWRCSMVNFFSYLPQLCAQAKTTFSQMLYQEKLVSHRNLCFDSRFNVLQKYNILIWVEFTHIPSVFLEALKLILRRNIFVRGLGTKLRLSFYSAATDCLNIRPSRKLA